MTALFTLKKVRSAEAADDFSFKLHLFRDKTGIPCGWYIGPVSLTTAGIEMPYLPPSRKTLASVAIVRAIAAARAVERRVCVVDPQNLWDTVWSGGR